MEKIDDCLEESTSKTFKERKNERKQTKKDLTVLYLHGFLQSSQIFSKRVEDINKILTKNYNLTSLIPDGLFLIETTEEGEKRGWMKFENVDYQNLDMTSIKENLGKQEQKYLGLNESIDLILNIAKNNKIDVIFGFSQGAILNLLLNMLRENNKEVNDLFVNLKFIVIASGFITPSPNNDEFVELIKTYKSGKKLEIPCLHIYGENDDHIPPEKSKEVIEMFTNNTVYEHKGKHFIPVKSADKNYYLEYFKKFV